MKKTLAILLFITINFLGNSQSLHLKEDVKIKWGEEIKMKKGSDYGEVLYANEETICLTKWIKEDFIIEIQDNNLKTIKEQEILLKLGKKDISLEGVFEFADNIIVMGSHSNKKEKINTLYYKTINNKTLKEKTAWKIISEISFLKKRRDGYFSYTLSDDEKKLLIYISQPYDGNDSPERFGFKVFDNTMDLLWEKDVQLKYNENLFSIKNFIISDDADVYVIGRKLVRNIDKPKKIEDREYHILSYTVDNDNQDYQIQLEDKYVKDITFGFNHGGNLLCGGFYSENGTNSSGIKGVFFIEIDTRNGIVLSNTSKPLKEDFITEDWSDKYKKKVQKKNEKAERKGKKPREIEAYEFILRDFIINPDGTSTIIAEQYYMRVVTTTTRDANGNTTTRTTYHYYYNDIYIINIDSSGEILWTSKIDKYQHSINDGGYRSSYHLHSKADQLYLIYNLSTRAYYEKEVWKALPKAERKNYLTIISTVNRDGDIKDDLLLNNTQEEIYIVPKNCEQINPEKSLLYTWKRRNIRLGTLEFEN